jgi:hypothetical protein
MWSRFIVVTVSGARDCGAPARLTQLLGLAVRKVNVTLANAVTPLDKRKQTDCTSMQTSPKLRSGKSASELNRLPRSKKAQDDTPEIIRLACRAAVTEALRSLEISTRRLLTIEQTVTCPRKSQPLRIEDSNST